MTDDWITELEGWLAVQLGGTQSAVSNVRVEGVVRPPVGQSSDTFIFTLRWTGSGVSHRSELVLRVEPAAGGIFDQPDAVREARVIAGLAKTTAPVPRVRWIESSGAVLGRPFFVMEHVPGNVPGAKPSIHSAGWLPTLSPSARRRLWDTAMDGLVAVHAAPWRENHAFLRRDGESALVTHIDRLEEWYNWTTQGRVFPVTDAALAYLRAHLHELVPSEEVLVWGDARLGNMIFSPDAELRALLDWEVATVGPAQIDLAHWLVFDEFMTRGLGVERLDGFPSREETIATYEQRSGRAMPDLEYFEIMQMFFLAGCIIRQSDMRVEQGDLPAQTTMGRANALTAMLAPRLGLPAPELSADYMKHRTLAHRALQ